MPITSSSAPPGARCPRGCGRGGSRRRPSPEWRFSLSVRVSSPAPTISRPSIAARSVMARSGLSAGSATLLCSHSGHGLPGRSAVAASPTSHQRAQRGLVVRVELLDVDHAATVVARTPPSCGYPGADRAVLGRVAPMTNRLRPSGHRLRAALLDARRGARRRGRVDRTGGAGGSGERRGGARGRGLSRRSTAARSEARRSDGVPGADDLAVLDVETETLEEAERTYADQAPERAAAVRRAAQTLTGLREDARSGRPRCRRASILSASLRTALAIARLRQRTIAPISSTKAGGRSRARAR